MTDPVVGFSRRNCMGAEPYRSKGTFVEKKERKSAQFYKGERDSPLCGLRIFASGGIVLGKSCSFLQRRKFL